MGRGPLSTQDRDKDDDISCVVEPGVSSIREGDEYIAYGVAQDSDHNEPEIVCRHLDRICMLGLNKTTSRLRFLVNWLVTSMLQLRLTGSNGDESVLLVEIYGPKIKYKRGAAVSFNVRDRNRDLIRQEVVQKLAEEHDISLSVGMLKSHTYHKDQAPAQIIKL